MARMKMKRNQNNGEDINSPGRTGRGWMEKLTLRTDYEIKKQGR